MEALIFLFFLLAIVTVVGHLIWVALEKTGRFLFADDVVVNNGSLQRPDPHDQQLKDLAITEDQISQFYCDGKLSEETFEKIMVRIREERASLVTPRVAVPAPTKEPARPSVPTAFDPSTDYTEKSGKSVDGFISVTVPNDEITPPPRPPRKSFSEVLSSFMEESNIRWGEIIGGLLIIGCSTALVVSLWARSFCCCRS